MSGRGSRHRAEREAHDAALELTDLFRLAAGTGMPVSPAVSHVARRAPRQVRAAAREAATVIDRGLPLADALALLADRIGPAAAPLVEALTRSAVTGEPAAPLLDAVAAAARDRRLRSAQEAARRLPVTMLLPLALCILPAAVVLAVVPVLVASLRSLAP